MKTITIGKHQIQFYDSPRELPIRRYAKYNKHMTIQMQVGNDLADYDKRMQRANGYVSAKDFKSASVELTNQRQGLHNALTEYVPASMALASMVYSINGKLKAVRTDDDLAPILDQLDKIGFTKAMLDETLSELKKK